MYALYDAQGEGSACSERQRTNKLRYARSEIQRYLPMVFHLCPRTVCISNQYLLVGGNKTTTIRGAVEGLQCSASSMPIVFVSEWIG
nr:hypothetical protein Q903MT_gene6234 [Picea sitchensis]